MARVDITGAVATTYRQVRSLRLHGAVLLVAAMFAGNAAVCAAARTAAQEMACCKAGHLTCGKDDERERLLQVAPDHGTYPRSRQAGRCRRLLLCRPARRHCSRWSRKVAWTVPADGTWKRPHDPPHLHAFSLLI